MKIATWNVNSVRARLQRLLSWLDRQRPDLLCLQETKVTDDKFPRMELEALGYAVECHGQKTYNGVALLARSPLHEVRRGLPPGGPEAGSRVIAADFEGIRVVNVYVPNGQRVDSEAYAMKLAWMEHLRASIAETHRPGDPLLCCGDFNVAPEDRDVHDPELWRGKVLCSEPERGRWRALLDWGLADALRIHHEEPGIYTWWDYRLGGFRRDRGLRIDHILCTEPVAARLRQVTVDREERGGEKPSDHAPVVAILD